MPDIDTIMPAGQTNLLYEEREYDHEEREYEEREYDHEEREYEELSHEEREYDHEEREYDHEEDMDLVTEELDYTEEDEEMDTLTLFLQGSLFKPSVRNIRTIVDLINSHDTPNYEGLYINVAAYLNHPTTFPAAFSAETIDRTRRIRAEIRESYDAIVAARIIEGVVPSRSFGIERLYFSAESTIKLESVLNDLTGDHRNSRTFHVTSEVMACLMHNIVQGRHQFYTTHGVHIFDYS